MSSIFDHLKCGSNFSKSSRDRKKKLFETKSIASVSNVSVDNPKRSTQLNFFDQKLEEENEDVIMQISEAIEDNMPQKTTESIESISDSDNDEEMDDAEAFRKRLRIHVKGENIPSPIASFSDISCSKSIKPIKRSLLEVIESSDWKEPTAVQMQAIPSMLNKRDLLVGAPTGSGKSAAFIIPVALLLSELNQIEGHFGPRCIILAPTRDLSSQLFREAQRLCGSCHLNIHLLTSSLAASAIEDLVSFDSMDVVISTPLRLVSVLKSGNIDLGNVSIVVLDEADKLFEMSAKDENVEDGFLSQIDTILSACTNTALQRCLFSATIGPKMIELSQSLLKLPIRIIVGQDHSGAPNVDQSLVYVGNEDGKRIAMRQLVRTGLTPPVMVFLQSKERACQLDSFFRSMDVKSAAIHSDLSQLERDNIVKSFRSGTIWILITTDLMSRGIDFRAVNLVINYDFPSSGVAYIHRIGRTGRGGRPGKSVTFFSDDDVPLLRSIANIMKLSGCDVADWMLSLKKPSARIVKKRDSRPIRREDISGSTLYERNRQERRKIVTDRSTDNRKRSLKDKRAQIK